MSITVESIVEDIKNNRNEEVVQSILRCGVNQYHRKIRERVRRDIKSGKSLSEYDSDIIKEEEEAIIKLNAIESNAISRLSLGISKELEKFAGTVMGEWKFANGLALFEVTAGFLRKERNSEMLSSEGHRKNAEFYTRIAKGLRDDQLIGLNVTVDAAENIRAEVFDACTV